MANWLQQVHSKFNFLSIGALKKKKKEKKEKCNQYKLKKAMAIAIISLLESTHIVI